MPKPANQKRGPRTKPNYLYAILSVALVLTLLGFFGLVILNVNQLMNFWRERVNLIAEIKPEASGADVQVLRRKLEREDFVLPGSVNFLSREEGAALLQEEFGEEFLRLDMPNPLYDVFTFNVRADYMESDSLGRIRSELMADTEMINDVFYQESMADMLAENLRKLSLWALGLGSFFILISILLIHNTIRLALYANRFLIKNMELVGASWGFISKPFIMRSLLHGLISGLMAVSILWAIQWFGAHDLPELKKIIDPLGFALLSLGLILLGILINGLSTFFVVNRYLRLRVDDLY